MTDTWDDDQPNPEQVKRQQIREERDADDIRQVMSTEQGRRVVWSVLEQGKVFGSTFAVDPAITAFNEGQRNIALALFMRVMSVCPEQYLKMAAEANTQEEK
ncbi:MULTISPECIES: Bbp19 family protein [Pseudescherichia]|uniref:Bbp19 family protein n=1 Tax=Pseudescherichia TaxID=2055880 RepID=UPI00301C30BE